MLGSAVYPAFVQAGHEVVSTDLNPIDVGGLPVDFLDVRDFDATRHAIETARPDLVLHLAAETDLEVCEKSPDEAYRTNTVGTHHVAIASRDVNAAIVYISTAGVFDGQKTSGPYTEFDDAHPINVYGDSKYQGEVLVMRLVPHHFIVRAGWMVGGGSRDHKFVARILAQIDEGRSTIHAVSDKFGTPTYTRDFATNLLELVATPHHGLYHMACRGEGTRVDVAREIVAAIGRPDVTVVPVDSDHFSEEYPAPRPRSEMMRNLMLDLHGLNRMRPWQEALRDYLGTLGRAAADADVGAVGPSTLV
jgi:dTDP-4-dehydrorhamnose reductase